MINLRREIHFRGFERIIARKVYIQKEDASAVGAAKINHRKLSCNQERVKGRVCMHAMKLACPQDP